MTNRFPPSHTELYEDSFFEPNEAPDRGRVFTTKNMQELIDLVTPSVESAAPTITTGAREPTIVPHFNILKSKNFYTLELAVPGFLESELSVTVDKDVLTVKGQYDYRGTDFGQEDIYRGIPEGSFVRKFQLNGRVQVKGADYENGILRVLIAKLSDSERPTEIVINADKPTSAPQILNEIFAPEPRRTTRVRSFA